jgi:hypothetical protein
MRDMTPHTLNEAIPTVCRVEDVCRILQISRSTFYGLCRQARLPIAEIKPRITGGPRFKGGDVQAYLGGHQAAGEGGRRVAARTWPQHPRRHGRVE